VFFVFIHFLNRDFARHLSTGECGCGSGERSDGVYDPLSQPISD
jgi:hypothetical protein